MISNSKFSSKLLPIRLKDLLWIIPVSITWSFFWFWPWQNIIPSLHWPQLGIAIIVFTIPGACVYGLIVNRSTFTFSHITSGFVISHLIIALLGTLGRLIHLSFETVKIIMAFTGLILLLRYSSFKFQDRIKVTIWNIDTNKILPVLLLLLVAMVACLVVIQRVLTDDDLSYLAFVTNWQNSTRLDFNDIIFGRPELVSPRFWLMSIPFAQALLADISQIPGILLLGGYYEPYLVIIAVLCWYELARTLNLSPHASSAASILQLVFLLFLSEYLHPGAPFFNQLGSDKATAAFIIAPIFFQSLFRLFKQSTKGNFLMFFMAGASLTLTHPVILAYSIFIGGMLILLNWKNTGAKEKVITILILFAVLLPQIALRFSNIYSQGDIPYTSQEVFSQRGIESMISRWGNTQFYGFNRSILDMKVPYEENLPIPQPIVVRGWLIIPLLSTIFSLKHAGKKTAAQFILACFLLGLLAGLPFTGWIIGYFLSAYMLERAIWLFPFGLSTVYTFLMLRDHVRSRLPTNKPSNQKFIASSNWYLLSITVVAICAFSLYLYENNLPNFEKFISKSQRYQDLSLAGKELDNRISVQAYVIGSPSLNDLIPGISWKSKLITFRISDPLNMSYFSTAERIERISDTQKLFSKSISAEDQLSLLEKYDVQFLFLQRDDIRFLNALITKYPNRIKPSEVGGVILVEIE